MLYIYTFMLLLPTAAFSYSINVKGTIELGDQVADVFKSLKDRFLNQMESVSSHNERNKKVISYSYPVAENSDGMPEPQDFPFLNNIPIMEKSPANSVRIIESVDVPLLEEIVSKKKDMVHVYGSGSHGRIGKKHGPLNKIMA